MWTSIYESARELMTRGGVVMWPLLALSLISVTLLFERIWFFLRANNPGRLNRVRLMARLIRQKNLTQARDMAQADRSVYSRAVLHILDEQGVYDEAAASATVERFRPRLERFMPTLSTIITVAPMLGILGTVLGIIASFNLLSNAGEVTDPRLVSQGIGEALITTAAGLVIAIFTLFPYNALRVQVERSLTVIETLAWSAVTGSTDETGQAKQPPEKENHRRD